MRQSRQLCSFVMSAICAFAAIPLTGAFGQTITNPDFQANGGSWVGAATGWTAFGANKWEGVFDGTRSWVQGVSDFAINGGICGVRQTINVTSGTQYRLAVYTKVTNTDLDSAIGVSPNGGTDATTATYGTVTTATGWTQVTVDFTASASTSTIFLRGRNPKSWVVSGWAHFDGVTIQVLTPPSPAINRSPSTLSPSVTVGGNAADQSFTVSNSGGGTLNYSITDDVSWLSASPTSGTSTGEADTITVTYTTSGLAVGTYNATITITDGGASNSPQTIAVTLTVNATPPPTPTITRAPASLAPSVTVGGNAASQSFTVQNSGGSTLNYSITDNATWLSQTPTSGTSTGETDTITVNYATSGLAVGTYNATITISDAAATNNPQTIAVTLTVNNVPSGSNLVTNPSFEGTFTGGLAANWSSWTTGGTGYWKQSARLGRIGSGMYNGTAGFSETVAFNPKVVLLSDLALGHAQGMRTALPDALIIGRLFIDPQTGLYLSNPEFYGAQHADNSYNMSLQKPGINAWQGMNEQICSCDVPKMRLVGRFEKAFADRCRVLGIKSCVLNIAVGNPGNANDILLPEIVNALAAGDYAGYHAYGGNTDQLMIGPQQNSFALRWRTYMDMYAQNGYRMPPVVYTECTTFNAWHGVFTAAQIRDDLNAFEALTKPDRWSAGMCIFVVGSGSPQWDGWETVGQPTIYNDCGAYNLNHPADAWDGIYSQQFGETSGGFTGGIRQVVSVTSGHVYQLMHSMKHETYGVNTNLNYQVGYDLTGQTANPNAASVVWSANLMTNPKRETDWWYDHSVSFTATGSSVSIWFKGSQASGLNTWRVMIDKVSLQEVGTGTAPVITRSPATLSPSVQVGGNAANQTFTVQNTGAGMLSYTITDDATWLSVSPASGTSTGEVDTMTVSYTTSSLAQGTYNATITISDPNATNNPQTIAVTLSVLGPPSITRSPATLTPSCNVGSNAANQTFTVQNGGGGTLNYSITDNVTWLSVSPTSGTSTGEVDTMTVSYTTSGLAAGTYNGTITITDAGASNSPQTIAVTLTVNAALTVAEDFNTVPAWTSEYNATWGGAATWSSVSGGQSGNHLQATRNNNGSSSKVKVYNLTTNTNYTLTIYMKGASSTSTYWVECAYKMGSNTAQNFDSSGGTWTMIKKFENVAGSNGNGDTWTIYTKTFNSGANAQISVGFKLGVNGGTAPTARWDTLRIQ